jgi:two-component system, cell cycle response regulator
VVGRASAADLSIPDTSLSRRHAQLVRSGPEYVLEDLGSRNGIFLNGLRVHSVTLCNGDTVQLGDVVFVFHESDG